VNAKRRCLINFVLAGLFLRGGLHAEDLNAPAVIEVTDKVVVRDIRRIGANPDTFSGFGGGLEWGSNQFVWGGGFEPLSMRWKGTVVDAGAGWFESDNMPPFWSGALVKQGYLDGQRVRIYRMFKKDGSPLDITDGPTWWQHPKYVNIDELDHVRRFADTTIATVSKEHPRGGYVHNRCDEDGPKLYGMTCIPYDHAWTDVLHNSPTDATWYYKVAALNSRGLISRLADCAEVSARPDPGIENGPRIFYNGTPTRFGDFIDGYRLTVAGGRSFSLDLWAKGGKEPLTWEVVEGELPEGLSLTATQRQHWTQPAAEISGTARTKPAPTKLVIRVTDSVGKSDSRTLWINPSDSIPGTWGQRKRHHSRQSKERKFIPQGPTNVRVEANADSITLRWDPSPDKDIVGYVIYRSDTPFAEQQRRIYLSDTSITPRIGDQVVIEMFKTETPGPQYWPPDRVQGWKPVRDCRTFPPFFIRSDTLRYERVYHGKTSLPEEFTEPGSSYLKVTETSPVRNRLQATRGTVLAGTRIAVEFWARAEGIADGKLDLLASFSGENEPPEVTKSWTLGGDWTRCALEYDVQERATMEASLLFTGPGSLHIDDLRIPLASTAMTSWSMKSSRLNASRTGLTGKT